MQEENKTNETKVEQLPEIEGMQKEEVELLNKHGLLPKEEKKTPDPEKKEQEEKPEKLDLDSLTPEQEKENLGKWNKNEQAMYWERKRERSKRQAAQAEAQLERARRVALEKELDKYKAKPVEPAKNEKDEGDEIDNLLETEKDEREDKERPLTVRDFEERERKKASEAEEQKAKARVINSKLEYMEIEAREKYQDLDPVLDLATEIFSNAKENKLKSLIQDPQKYSEVERKIREWAEASINIFDENPKNLTELAYELGKLHPNYKEAGAKAEIKTEKLSDDKLKKLEENAKKPRTSASLSGGSSRMDDADELTYEQLTKLSMDEWKALPQKLKDKALGKK